MVDGANAEYGRRTRVPPSGLDRPDENQAAAVSVPVCPGLVRFRARPWLNLRALYSYAKGPAPMLIAANKAVSIDYTLTNDAGEVIDSSAGVVGQGIVDRDSLVGGDQHGARPFAKE